MNKNKLSAKNLSLLVLGFLVILSTSCDKTDSTNVIPDDLTQSGERTMATSTSSNLLLQTTFESSDALSSLYMEKANSNSITRSTSPVRSGSYSGKFVINKSDGLVAGSTRAEITPLSPEKSNAERWYGLSVYLPTSHITDPCEESLFQLHGGATVPLAMITGNGRWTLVLKNKTGITRADLGAYEKGAWTDWVVHVKYSSQSDGLLEVWKNGSLVFRRNNAPNTHDGTLPFFKFGVYKWGWRQGEQSTTQQRIVYYDNVKVGNANSSYAEVAPGSNSAPAPAPAPEPSPAPAPTPTVTPIIAINAGGSAFKASNGITYAADKYSTGGLTMKTTKGISNTADDVLYQSDRYGDFSYVIPVSNGTYEVTLKFSEFLHSSPYKRRFDVTLEDQKIFDNLDVYKIAGGNRAYDVVRTCVVRDGKLTLTFKSERDYAMISAFHIIKK